MRRILLKLLLALALIALGSAIAARIYAPVSAWLLVFAGRTDDCSMRAALRGIYRRHLYFSTVSSVSAVMRRVQTDGQLMLTETPYGTFWEPVLTDVSAAAAQVAEIASKYSTGADPPVRPGDVILDCGANIGAFTAYALKLGARRVVAIEPDPLSLECLRRNFKNDTRVVIYPKGVWKEETVLTLHESSETSAKSSFVWGDGPGAKLPVTTIDKIIEELALERVDFIKMDIEGSEEMALAGGRDTIARWRPRMELEVSNNNQATLARIIKQHSPEYRIECLVCFVDPGTWRVRPTLITAF